MKSPSGMLPSHQPRSMRLVKRRCHPRARAETAPALKTLSPSTTKPAAFRPPARRWRRPGLGACTERCNVLVASANFVRVWMCVRVRMQAWSRCAPRKCLRLLWGLLMSTVLEPPPALSVKLKTIKIINTHVPRPPSRQGQERRGATKIRLAGQSDTQWWCRDSCCPSPTHAPSCSDPHASLNSVTSRQSYSIWLLPAPLRTAH